MNDKTYCVATLCTFNYYVNIFKYDSKLKHSNETQGYKYSQLYVLSRAVSGSPLFIIKVFHKSCVVCFRYIFDRWSAQSIWSAVAKQCTNASGVWSLWTGQETRANSIYICNKFNTESIFGNDLQLQNAASNSCFVRFPHAYRTIKWRQSRVRRNDSDDAYYYLKKRMTWQ